MDGLVNKKRTKSSLFTLSDILLIVSKNLKPMILFSIFFSSITFIYSTFFLQKLFISESKIKSLGQNSDSRFSNIASQFGVSIPGQNKEDSWVSEDIIKSRKIAKEVVNEKFRTLKYGDERSLVSILFNEKNKLRNSQDEIKAIKNFIKSIGVKENKNSGIFTISITSFEPGLAKSINKVLIDKLHQNQKIFNKNILGDSKKFIKNRINEIKVELNIAEENLRTFTSRNRRIDNSPLLQLDNQRLSREVEVLKQVYITLKQQLELVKIEEVKDSNYIVLVDFPDLPISPYFPKTINFTIITFFLAFSTYLLIIILLEFYHDLSTIEKEKISQAGIEIKNLLKIK